MAIIHSQYVTWRKVEIRIHPHVYKDANIFSACTLCIEVRELIPASQITSVYSCCAVKREYLTASLASTYSLSTAPP